MPNFRIQGSKQLTANKLKAIILLLILCFSSILAIGFFQQAKASSVFQSGWESGNRNDGVWIGSVGTVVTSPVHDGNYAVKFGYAQALYAQIPSANSCYFSCWFLFSGLPSFGGSIPIVNLTSANYVTDVNCRIDQNDVLSLDTPSGSYSGLTLTQNVWYQISLDRIVSSGNGVAQLWVNGVLKVDRETETIIGSTTQIFIGSITASTSFGYPTGYAVFDTAICATTYSDLQNPTPTPTSIPTPTPSPTPSPSHNVVCEGDSITAGSYVTTPYPTVLATLSGYAVTNHGYAGSCTADILNIWNGDRSNGYTEVCVLGGVNDIRNNIPISTIENNLYQIWHDAIANFGIKVYALTITPFGGAVNWTSANQNELLSINAWIISNTSSLGAVVVDTYSLLNNSTHTGYLQDQYNSFGDNIHPSQAGANAIANAVYSAMTGSTPSPSPSPAPNPTSSPSPSSMTAQDWQNFYLWLSQQQNNTAWNNYLNSMLQIWKTQGEK